MEDVKIIDLYFARDTQAITETDEKYGKYCYSVAFNVLNNREDSSECVNDTYNVAWNTIPPNRPTILSAFLGKITRNLSINRLKQRKSKKHGGGQYEYVYEELATLIASNESVEDSYNEKYLIEVINKYLESISEEKRKIFVGRYWYMNSISDIAHKLNISESKVKMILLRTRKQLKIILEKEGITL